MVDRAEREPTMEEIVGALRETRRAAGRGATFTVVGGQREDKRAPDSTMNAQSATDVAELRDNEIQRLLGDNARLNERVMYLLKAMENRQQPHRTDVAVGVSGDAILQDVRAILEAELRPVLDVLLRLLEKLHASPITREPHNNGGIIDLDASRAHE
jgi:hypothetical protein